MGEVVAVCFMVGCDSHIARGCNFVNGNCDEWPLTNQLEGYRCDSESPRGQVAPK